MPKGEAMLRFTASPRHSVRRGGDDDEDDEDDDDDDNTRRRQETDVDYLIDALVPLFDKHGLGATSVRAPETESAAAHARDVV